NTGMVGYPECFTDPSYAGQILVLTYPLVGNYGVPGEDTPHARGLACGLGGETLHGEETPRGLACGLGGETAYARGLDGFFESAKVQIAGLVVSEHCQRDSHWNSRRNLDAWLRVHQVPALAGVDTRALTQHLRSAGAMLGKLVVGDGRVEWRNPN